MRVRVCVLLLMLAVPWPVTAQSPVDAEAIIRAAPAEAWGLLIAPFDPCDQMEWDILAAALLDAEGMLHFPPAARDRSTIVWDLTWDEETRQRRREIADAVNALDEYYAHTRGTGGAFAAQWRVLSGQLQAVEEADLIPSMIPVWRARGQGGRPPRPEACESPGVCSMPDGVSGLRETIYRVLIEAHDRTQADGHEYGGFILRIERDNQPPQYVAQVPVRGQKTQIQRLDKYAALHRAGYGELTATPNPDRSRVDEFLRRNAYLYSWKWLGDISIVGSYHSHPDRWGQNYFSLSDIRTAIIQMVPEYLITPSCRVRTFTPQEGMLKPPEGYGTLPAVVGYNKHIREGVATVTSGGQ